MFSAILFDFNGVLVDDEAVHLEAFQDALLPLGVSLSTQEYVDRYLGYDDRGAFRAILEDRGLEVTASEIDRLIEAKKPLYLSRAQKQLNTFPGAERAVRRLARYGPVVIVSGALRDEILLGLEVLGVSDLIEHVVSAEDTGACKPDPEGYLLGLAYLEGRLGQVSSGRVLVVEDSLAGVQAAKAARLFCAAVTHSYPRPALEGAGADCVVDTLDELTDDVLATAFKRVHA